MFTKRKCLQLKKEMRPESLVFYNYLIALCTLERSLSFVFMLPHVTFQITLRDEQFLTDLTRKISLMPMNHSEQSLNIVLMKMIILWSKLKEKYNAPKVLSVLTWIRNQFINIFRFKFISFHKIDEIN